MNLSKKRKFSKNEVKLKKIQSYKWFLCHRYVRAHKKNNKLISLHQLILGKKKGFEIDHKDNCPLNNLNSNLRFATSSQNHMNRLNVKGLSWYEPNKKWRARMQVNYKGMYLGYFNTRADALEARRKAERKYFRKFAHKPKKEK